jgi:catechol 2,3-dioxygenase-like lactoylglutathione lyase family enzyme
MIAGVHAIVFADDAQTAREFFRDVLDFPAVDAGEGWLVFGLPPAELACHPAPGSSPQGGRHAVYLMCERLGETVSELEARGVEFVTPVSDEGWGLLTRFKVPGAGEMGLYEPRHPSPLDASRAGGRSHR